MRDARAVNDKASFRHALTQEQAGEVVCVSMRQVICVSMRQGCGMFHVICKKKCKTHAFFSVTYPQGQLSSSWGIHE
jgi:hypothetical protein